MSTPQARQVDQEARLYDVAEAANREASRVRMRALRERRKIVAGGFPGSEIALPEPKKSGWKTVWTPEETEQIKTCLAANMPRHQIVLMITSKSARQVDNKIKSLGQASKHFNPGGMTPHDGYNRPDPKPSVALIEERDRRLNADAEARVHLDPNIRLMGDPSPARRAMLARYEAEQLAEAASRRPSLGMSAVPPTRLGQVTDTVQLARMGLLDKGPRAKRRMDRSLVTPQPKQRG